VVRNASVSKPAAILTAPTMAARTESALRRRFCLARAVTRTARLLLYVSQDREEKIMETILIIVVLLFLFGGGGYYWRSRRR
jgi:hypothetical protein